MRVITKEQQDAAGKYAMKGFAIGAAQWACVGVFATAAASVAFPGFKKTPIQNKFYIVMAMALGGGAHLSDRYMVQFERRGRANMLDETTRQRYNLIYGDEEERKKAQEALKQQATA
ncbi:hypothetical protein INT43_003580 [Umbelopsis isabellina]|uniref:Uncharacterized protein n=1 Tax=Mortierella isabellina TaxID=91625 RepID=A0A8H7UFJ8_MORIS|nr:hypothetical protein INT43_003580 [Umbelopsis isabellina]